LIKGDIDHAGKPFALLINRICCENPKFGKRFFYNFLNNSYLGVTCMQDQGASLPHYACYYLNHIDDWKYQNGMGNIMFRNLIFPKFISEGAKNLTLIKTVKVADIIASNSGRFETKLSDHLALFKPCSGSGGLIFS